MNIELSYFVDTKAGTVTCGQAAETILYPRDVQRTIDADLPYRVNYLPDR
jgi:hypothetical protein